MSQERIRDRYRDISRRRKLVMLEQKKLDAELSFLREECEHPAAFRTSHMGESCVDCPDCHACGVWGALRK